MLNPEEILDVAVVGGGFAGSALAATLHARGVSVALCDPHEVHPQDFRAEKLSPGQVETLARLDLAAPVLRAAREVGELAIYRRGRRLETRPTGEYGLDYAALVEALRGLVPESVRIRRRVDAVEQIGGVQRVTLLGAEPLRARLVVLATGQSLTLRKSLALDRVTRRENHSLAIGFDVDGPSQESLTYYGERIEDRIGYLTLFPVGERLRANLFAYHDIKDEWTRAFRRDPQRLLFAALGGLPPFSITSPPVLRPIHLYDPPARMQAGVALIGDAYSTTCPAGGGGLDKALTDIERLLRFLPRWLGAARGVSSGDIAQYYQDPLKRASETRALRNAEISRASAIDPGCLLAGPAPAQLLWRVGEGLVAARLGTAPRPFEPATM